MAKSPIGVCRLCRQERSLCDSHFLAAIFYRHLGLDATGTFTNRALVRLTKEKMAHVPKQVTKYLLCQECERRFSNGGESWTSHHGYQPGRQFLLQDFLKNATPKMQLPSGEVFHASEIPEINWNKLAYFALSVFWRGACDSWTDNPIAKPFIAMDARLEEELRQFLLGLTDYPRNILLMLKVAAGRSGNIHMISFPSRGTLQVPHGLVTQYSFFVPGMIFTLVPDQEEDWVQQGCLIHGARHPIFLMESDRLFFQEEMILACTAKPSQKVIEEVRKMLSKAQNKGPRGD